MHLNSVEEHRDNFDKAIFGGLIFLIEWLINEYSTTIHELDVKGLYSSSSLLRNISNTCSSANLITKE